MGFGESFSAFTKGVGEKVKGNAEVMNLRSQINAEQKQINDLKAVLGGKYYDLYKDTASPEPELQETLDAIGLCFLFFVDHVANHHLEGLHCHIDARVKEHQGYQTEDHGSGDGQTE